MSKESYIGGNYIERTGGKTRIYAGGSIENSSINGKFIQNGGEFGVTYGINEAPPLPTQPIEVLVEFRPKLDWKGEFGFDWFRLEDTQLFMDKKFKDIVAYQYKEERCINKETDGNKYGGYFKADQAMFNRLKGEYSPFSVPWKTIENEAGQESSYQYYIPWLSLLKNKEAKITFFAEIKHEAEYLEFEASSFFTFTPNRIDISGRTSIALGTQEITIKCIEEFTQDQTIELKAYKTNEQGELEEAIAGKLKVWANDASKQKEKRVVFVKVKTPELIPSEGSKTPEVTDEKERINKYLGQAYIKLSDNSDIVTLDLSDPEHHFTDFVTNNQVDSEKTSGRLVLHNYLKAKLELQYPDRYQSHFKAFYFEENGYHPSGGNLSGYSEPGADYVVVFKSKNAQTAAHEFLHSMMLPHTFTNKEAWANALYTYEYAKTDNLMDYSHHDGNNSNRKSLFYWQWKTANESIT